MIRKNNIIRIMTGKYPKINLNEQTKKLVDQLNGKIKNNEIELETYKCICCEEQHGKEIYTNDSYGIQHRTVLCAKCGMIYADPRMTEKAQDLFYRSDIYRDIYDSNGEFSNHIEKACAKLKSATEFKLEKWDSQYWNNFAFINFLASNISMKKIHTVCEIGAGSGANLLPFKNLGKECMGIEVSRSLIMNAKEFGLDISYTCINEVDKKIDLFLLIHVLEHLHDPVSYLKSIAKRGTAYLIIEVPGVVDRFGDSIQNAHNFTFSKNTLQAVCSKAGFSCINIDHYNDKNWIVGLFKFQNSENDRYLYNETLEVKRVEKIIFNQKLKNLVPISTKRLLSKLIGNKRNYI